MLAARAVPSTPASMATEATASTRTRCGAPRPSHSFATTASVASTPNPAPVTRVLPAFTASSCRASSPSTATTSLAWST